MSLQIIARDVRFNANRLTVPEATLVTLALDNQDSGIPHNLAVFDSGGGVISKTEIAPGPNQMAVTFTAPDPGTYTFLCEVHPRQMVGTLLVQ